MGEGLKPQPGPPSERRRALRQPVIKSAKIVTGQAPSQGIFNCLVLDESPSGLLVDLGTVVALPDEVLVQFHGGASYLAHRRWSAGTKAGFAFIGGQIVSGEVAQRMQKLADVLHAQGVLATVNTLRVTRFFDNDELRRAAEDAESAYYRLDAILTGESPL